MKVNINFESKFVQILTMIILIILAYIPIPVMPLELHFAKFAVIFVIFVGFIAEYEGAESPLMFFIGFLALICFTIMRLVVDETYAVKHIFETKPIQEITIKNIIDKDPILNDVTNSEILNSVLQKTDECVIHLYKFEHKTASISKLRCDKKD